MNQADQAEPAPKGSDAPDQAELFATLGELRESIRSLTMATIGDNGEPHASYAPFVNDGRDLVVFISALALHTRDLLARPQASVMLITDEADSRQIFARSRLTYQCRAEVVAPEDEPYTPLLERLEARHGKTVGLLRSLPDFTLFRLVPESGLLVLGFGNAHLWHAGKPDELTHVSRA